MSFANGKCIVTKKQGKCLVLPVGTLSPTRQNFISKEGCDKLLEILKNSEDKVKGVCVINRQEYDNCIFIPRGVMNPKIRFLMSPEAIEGMASAFNQPEESTPQNPDTSTTEKQKETPPNEESIQEEVSTENVPIEDTEGEERRIKTDEPNLDVSE